MSPGAGMTVDGGSPTPGMSGFLRAVVRRFDTRTLGLGALVIAGLVLVGGLGLVSMIWAAKWPTIFSRVFETTVTAIVIFVAVVCADEAVDRGAPRVTTYGAAIVVAAFVGAWLGFELREASGLRPLYPPGHVPTPHWATVSRFDRALIGILVGGLATFVHVNRRTALAARRRQQAAEQARAKAQRRTLESELQALQARVEPAFLFNTLQRIRTLYRQDAERAGTMMEDLIVYLRAALPHMRESSSTVEQEARLARSWLDIVGRSSSDWRIVFDVADSAGRLPLPALIVLPLVQHAVTGALVEGSFALRLAASTTGGRLVVEVETSTDAFVDRVGGWPLLEQLRERLFALYGDMVRLETERRGQGSAAVVALPIEDGRGRSEAAAS